MKRIHPSLTRIAGMAFILLSFANSALAQPGRGGQDSERGSRADRRLAYIDQKLDLSDAQAEQVKSLLDEHHSQASAWFAENPDASRDERVDFHTRHRASLKAALEEVLSEEQVAELDEVLDRGRRGRGFARSGSRGATRNERGAERGGRGARGSRQAIAMLERRLDLTADQAEQLQELRAQHRQEAKAWMQANPDATREQRRAFLDEHRAERRTDLESILTPDQIERLEELRSTRREGAGRRDEG